MKRTIWRFGLSSAAIAIGMMAATLPLIAAHDWRRSDVLGYASILLAALLVFLGDRSHREREGNGALTFRRGVLVGLGITLVSTAAYMVAFQIVYFGVMPEFGDAFVACMIDRAQAGGASAAELAVTARQARTLKGLYDAPLTNAALTFGTTFPVGLVASVLAAAILRRKSPRAEERTFG